MNVLGEIKLLNGTNNLIIRVYDSKGGILYNNTNTS